MTAPVRPAGTKAYLRRKVVVVTDAAYDPDVPSLAILNGATALDVTKMFFLSSARPSSSTNLAKAPKRVGDGVAYEFVGESAETIGEVRYAVDPQAAALSTGKKCYEKLPEGTTGHLVIRYGPDRDDDLALAEFVSSYPFESGPQDEDEEGEAEGAEVAIKQTFAQTGPKSLFKAIAA